MTVAAPVITRNEVCDRCGSRAYVLVVLRGLDLTFCQHHGRQHMAVLAAIADSVECESVPVKWHAAEPSGARDGANY